jgi:hypothetical protein
LEKNIIGNVREGKNFIVKTKLTILLVILAATADADLLVKVEPPKILGQSVVVKLDMRNTFRHTVRSARAAVFVADKHGAVKGYGAKWLITGQKNFPPLPSGGTNQFNFVAHLNKQLSETDFTAEVKFDRVVLDNGRLANIPADVKVNKSQ